MLAADYSVWCCFYCVSCLLIFCFPFYNVQIDVFKQSCCLSLVLGSGATAEIDKRHQVPYNSLQQQNKEFNNLDSLIIATVTLHVRFNSSSWMEIVQLFPSHLLLYFLNLASSQFLENECGVFVHCPWFITYFNKSTKACEGKNIIIMQG